jgi:nicotinamide mononucleotide adenylyltransferase
MGWSKKFHAKSSLPKNKDQWALFIGRWQPLHEGHKEMFNQVLNDGGKVLIAIREVEPDEKNPWTPGQVLLNLANELEELVESGRLRIITIPDIESINIGRGVGYDVIEHIPPQEIHDISATKIREQMKVEGKL